MATRKTIADLTERTTAEFDGTELIEVLPTSTGVSQKADAVDVLTNLDHTFTGDNEFTGSNTYSGTENVTGTLQLDGTPVGTAATKDSGTASDEVPTNADLGDAAVGIVSESGGTPTGAVIERGSNSNGEYVKFADGTMICTHTVSETTGLYSDSSTVQGLDIYRDQYTWTFPSVFNAPPSVSINANYIEAGLNLQSANFTEIKNFELNADIMSISDIGTQLDLSLAAIGRWY